MSAGSCTIPPLFEDPFSPATFQNTHSIRFWHQRAARYGNSNDIKFLIEGSESQAEEYLRGLLASSITMFSLAVVWCIFLVAFKCIGPYGVGWLSGRHIPIKPKPLEADYAKEEEFQVASVSWDKKYKKILRSRKIMKGFVIFSGLGIVASSIMLSVKGVDSLLQTLDGADKFIDTATQLMKEGVILIDNVISSQDQLVIETKDAWEAINGICPQIREPICTEINDVNSCNFEGILETSEDMMMFLNFVADTRSLVFDELDKSRNDLLESIEFANSIGDISETFNWAFWCSLAFSLATAVASLFFVFRAIWPPSKSSICSCRNFFMIPAFSVLVLLSWTFAMVFVIGSVGLADMCYNSPDENFKALMNRMRGIFSPLIYKSIIFYVSGCPLDLVAPEVVDFLKFLVVFFDSIQAAIQNMNGQLVADVCDEQSGAKAVDATRFVSTSVCGAADLLRDLHLFLQCENWYPLYEEGVYNTMCYEGASGFSWVTSTQIAIVVFSMVILTLRVVFDDIDIVEPEPSLEQSEIKAIGSDGTDVPDDTDTRNNEEQAPLTGAENLDSLAGSEDENKFADAVSDWSSIGPVEEGGGVMDSLAASEDDVYSNDESESVDDLAVSSKWEQR